MKLNQLRFKHILLPVFLFFCFPILAHVMDINPKASEISKAVDLIKNDVFGVWDYTAENVPYEYSKGIIYISKEGKDLKVKVEIGESSLEGENVVADKNEVRFQVYVQGQKVDVNLSAKGNDLSGQGSSTEGVFSLSGKKRN